jgi:diguanylate cyclase (GGDEF)-like protein
MNKSNLNKSMNRSLSRVNGFRAKRLSWKKRLEKYYDEVVDYEGDVQKRFALDNAYIFFFYAVFLFVMEVFYWKEDSYGYLICEVLSVVSFGYYLVMKLVVPKMASKKKRRLVGMVYILIWSKALLSVNLGGDGTVSWTLLLCAIVTTSMLCIVPTEYSAVMVMVAIIDIIEFSLRNKVFTDALYNFVDDIIIITVCIAVNIIFAKRRFQDFERKEMLMGESSRDPLTQLYNRRYLERYFMRETAKTEICSLVLLDLDNFKAANDVHGHKAGDEVLRKTGNILRRSFRESDCVARLGGDEFAVFLPKLPDEQLVVRRVQSVLKQFPIVIEEGERTEVSVSIGIACKKSGEEVSYEQLCDKADVAMYSAKRSGKAQAFLISESTGRTLVITADEEHEYRNGLRIAQ